MKEFYYLDAQNKPCGPHSADELRALLILARLTPDTLITHKGSDKWVPLSTLTVPAPAPAPPPLVPNPVAGNCPKCREQLTFTNGRFPSRCPHCGFRLCADNPDSLWSNFKLALSKSFVLRGRATRIEYWSYYLFSTIFAIVAKIVCLFLMLAAGTLIESSSCAPEVSVSLFYICCALPYLMVFPLMTAFVRRLHDVGKSGWFILLPFVFWRAMFATIGSNVFISRTPERETFPIFIGGFFLLAMFGPLIYLFILTLLDSQRGQNKYGPSSKYPLG